MAKNKSKMYVEEAPGEPVHGNALNGFLWTVIVLAVVLYVGAYVLARTDGFRGIVENRLRDRLGPSVSVKKTSCDWGLNLIVQGVATEDISRRGQAGLRLGEARLEWSVRRWLKPGVSALRGLELSNVYLSFAPSEKGEWEPAALQSVAGLLEKWSGAQNAPAAPSLAPAGGEPEKKLESLGVQFDKIAMTLKDGRATWWKRNGDELAILEGVNIDVRPVPLPSREMIYYHVSAKAVDLRPGFRADNLDFEFLRTGAQDVVLNFQADWARPPAPDASTDRFEGLFKKSESENFGQALRNALQENSP